MARLPLRALYIYKDVLKALEPAFLSPKEPPMKRDLVVFGLLSLQTSSAMSSSYYCSSNEQSRRGAALLYEKKPRVSGCVAPITLSLNWSFLTI